MPLQIVTAKSWAYWGVDHITVAELRVEERKDPIFLVLAEQDERKVWMFKRGSKYRLTYSRFVEDTGKVYLKEVAMVSS